jgi:hypothetical protein
MDALPLSICDVDPELAGALKNHIKKSLSQSSAHFSFIGNVAATTVQLPVLTHLPEPLQRILRDRFLDEYMQEALVNANVINWCRNIRPLHAMRTRGGISFFYWGVILILMI